MYALHAATDVALTLKNCSSRLRLKYVHQRHTIITIEGVMSQNYLRFWKKRANEKARDKNM